MDLALYRSNESDNFCDSSMEAYSTDQTDCVIFAAACLGSNGKLDGLYFIIFIIDSTKNWQM